MYSEINTDVLTQQASHTAKEILSNCVHCGFCNATCPTYQVIGDERDGPRGRIYLIKALLEDEEASQQSLKHLDQCLTCRSCETHCPSGVEYGTLLEIGKDLAEIKIKRSWFDKSKRYVLRKFLLNKTLFATALRLGRLIKPVLPRPIKQSIPDKHQGFDAPNTAHDRKVLLLEACVQPAMQSSINQAAKKILNAFAIESIQAQEVCCGAISQHNNAGDEALILMKNNIDYWWPYVEQGIEAIISTASGCGVQLKDYAKYLQHDPQYKSKAARINELTQDIAEFVLQQDLSLLNLKENKARVSIQTPCTLQHGQKQPDVLARLMHSLGYESVTTSDKYLCCGSAGTYSLLQTKLAKQLREKKLHTLNQHDADMIITANIGCLHHLEAGADIPVRHWLELVASDMADEK